MFAENSTRLSRIAFLLLLTFSGIPAEIFSQTEISGVVNTYTRVLEIGECPNIIRVESAAELTEGQTVLIIGMQGGEMSIDNSNSFGTVSAEGLTAGQYDWTTIKSIQGTEITLDNFLSDGYNPDDVVQLVGVPTYDDAVVTSALTPMPWDGNLGGILAIEVDDTLTVSAEITASGMGFRGGQSVLADDNCTLLTSANDYFYENGNWRGSPKGEGIIPLVTGRELGRGAQANGGGGSNTHNAGGGGGSNRALGGNGGQNREPAFARCDGNFPGLGGTPLNFGSDYWFMGGGGGAGHRNNENLSSGGNGGGIIVLKAGTLLFDNGTITSDGEDGEPASGDGAGGAGAGGTIVLDITNGIIVSDINPEGTPLVSARGGTGGDVNNPANRCMGPGGGGSGGVLYSTFLFDADLSGGAAGLSRGSSECPEGPNGGTDGENGVQEMMGIKAPNAAAELSFIDIATDTAICPGDALTLSATLAPISFPVIYQWMINDNGNWVPLADSTGYSGADTSMLQIDALSRDASFQLIVSTNCTETLVSETINVSVGSAGDLEAAFNYAADGFTVTFINLTAGATDYEWTIDEIPFYSSTDPAPEFAFPGYGTYTVNLVAANACAMDSTSQVIAIGGAPIADFRGESSGSKCVPVTIQWQDLSEGIFDSYEWVFPGGTPSTSFDPNPVVVYDTPGSYDVSLTVSGDLGSNTRTYESIVKVFSPPQPAFSYLIEGLTVSFSSPSSEDLVHIWSFDDGTTSNEKDPVHTFTAPGAYEVTLNLQNGGCASSVTQTVLVFTTSVNHHQLSPYLQFYPNPTFGPLQLEGSDPRLFPLDLYLFNLQGQLLNQYKMDRSGSLDLSEYSSGAYFLLVGSPLGTGSWRIIKQ